MISMQNSFSFTYLKNRNKNFLVIKPLCYFLSLVCLPYDVSLDVEDVQLRVDRPVRLLNDGTQVRRVRIDFDRNDFSEIGYFFAQRNLEMKKKNIMR
jgi:hypothetical protein